MSPEQALGKLWIDERSDVFSFGCLLFEAVTRHRPFAADSRKRTFHKLLHEPTPRISEWCQWAPPGMQRLIDRCLEKDPEKRFHSMTEVSLGLTDVLEEMGTVRTGGGISKTGKQWPELPRQGVRRRVWVVPEGGYSFHCGDSVCQCERLAPERLPVRRNQ
jgi:serine/threonine protein kinase